MQRVDLAYTASLQGGLSTYGHSNSLPHCFFRRRYLHLNWPKSGGQKDEPVTLLRNSVIGTVDDAVAHVIFRLLEGSDESPKDVLFGETGHVFHGHQVGQDSLNEIRDFGEEMPAFVRLTRLLVIGRKRLARRTSSQKPQSGSGICTNNFLWRDFLYAF